MSWSGMAALCLVLMLSFTTNLKAQLTGTKNIPGDYADLATAITDLNTQGVGAGGVTLNLLAGNPQTSPAGGYAITTLTSTAANPIVITGNANTITASAALTAGNLNDAIFKVIGSDYVTIQGFTMQENAANTNTTAGTNNMTEWGVAVLYATATDGAKNVTIQNNTISLNRIYPNTFGIYANSRHTATAPTANADITSTAGALDNLHIYGNNISNANFGITVVGSTTGANEATGLDIGGNSAMTGNTLTNIGTTGSFSSYVSVSGTVNIIYVNNNTNVNVSYNSITSSSGAVTAGAMRGIFVDNTGGNPSGTVTTNINNNTISLSYAGTTANVQGINMGQSNGTTTVNLNGNTISTAYTVANSGVFSGIINSAGTSGAAISFSGNNFQNITFGAVATATVNCITNTASSFTTQTINGNTFTNLSLNTTGNVTLINTNNSLPASGTRNVNGNSIVGTFAKTASSGTVQLYNSNSTAGSTGTETTSGNNFSNITLTGSTSFAGWLCQDGTTSAPYGPGKTVTGNTFSNITVGTGTVTVLVVGYSNSASGTWNVAGNTISNITAAGSITGLTITQGNQEIRNNTVSGINSTAGTAIGIAVTSGVLNNLAYNKVYDIQSGAASGANVYGISVTGGTTNNIYNNIVGDLKAPTASGTAVIAGMRLNGGTTDNIYYNTVRINASSTGTNFGTSALSCSTSPTTMSLRNNILINKSTPAGTGTAVALRREATSLTAYAAASNNNLLYAGTPGTSNLIYADGTNNDQTLAAFQTRVAGRETFSVTEDVTFLSTTGANANFLHVDQAVASASESGGVGISGITDDFDGNVRFGNPGYAGTSITAVDIGADEFNGITAFTCATPAPGNTLSTATSLCLGAPVTLSVQNATPGTGVSYQWQSSSDGVTYTNVGGATSTTYSVIPTAAIYYQLVVTCGTGPVSTASTPVHLTFSNSVTATTPAARCGVGTINLAATPSAGVINWYTAATGGTTIGTGSPFTTPSISTTTTYYAAAEVIGTPVNAAIGAGGSTGTGAPYDFANGGYGGMKTQYLYTAAELTAAGYVAGNISSVAYEFTVAGSTLSGFNIQMGTTALTDLPTPVNIIGGLSTVYTAASMVPVVGVNTYTLSTPFYWDGASNLLVSISWSNGNTSNTSSTIKYDATAFNSSHSYRKDSENAPNMFAFTGSTASSGTFDRSTNRPRTTFNLTPLCSSARVPVVATVNTAPALTVTAAQTVCNDGVATLSVTSTLGDYDQYIWTPQTNLFTDAAGTVAYTGTSASTVYARTATAGTYTYTLNSNNTGSLCSAVASTTVTVIPAAITITPSIPAICVSGSAVYTIAPTTGFGTATFQWQSSADNVTFNDIMSATASSYTTPTISTTTFYAAQVKVGTTVCSTSPTSTLTVNNPTLLSTTPGTRCGTGTVTLQATNSAGTSINWYTVASGGTRIATGTSYTTPSISSTTTYYVAAEIGSSVNVPLGAGASTGTGAPYDFANGGYGGMKTQYLYTAAELTAAGYVAGNISGVAYEFTAAGSTLSGFNIQMGTTALTDLPTPVNILGGLSTVYTSASMVPTVGVNNYTFSTPFIWDGTSNVIVSISWSNNNTSNSASTIKYDATAFNSSHSYRKDSENAANMFAFTGSTASSGTFDRSTNRPRTTFNMTPSCSGGRMPIVATINTAPALSVTAAQTVCNDAVATVSVTSTVADYDQYIWTPQTNLFTDAAGTVAYTGTSASTVYVRTSTAGAYSYTLSANNTSTQCSQVASSTVTVVPGSLAVTASSPFICVSGAATLSVTPSTGFGTGTLQWQDSPDNITFTDIASANGTTYATPTVTSTTYYAVQLKIGATVCTTSPTHTLTVTNPTLVSTTPATRCGTGTAVIEAVGSGGTTINWYAAASGGVPVGTGSPFTTPSLSATTTYYAAAEVVGTTMNSALGTGSLTGTSAPYNYTNGGYGGMKTQYLYTAAELIAAGYTAGTINSIGFEITSAGSTLNGFNIQMGTTALTNFPTPVNILGGLTTVYTGTMVPTVGVNTYALSTPFSWDGTSNLVISLSWSNNNSSNSSSTIKYDATTNNMSQSYRKDNETAVNMFNFSGPTGSGTSTFDRITNRPRTHFNVTPVCSGTRTAVQVTVTTPPAITVTATNDSICPATSTTLDVTSSNSGYSYTWNGSLSGAQQTVSPSASTTYTVDALDMSGGSNDGCTNRATIAIALLPPVNAVSANASAATICAGDTIDLSSTASVALTFLTENFNAATNNWTTVNSSVNGTPANAAWTLRPSGHNPLGFWNTVAGVNSIVSNDNTQFYFTNSDSQGSGSTTDVTLTSPRIDASYASTLNLSFYHFFRFNAAGDICTVSASTNGSTWTSVQTYTATTGTATTFTQANLNLNAFAGNDTLYIRYTFHSAWGYGWAIDNVVLDGTTANLNYAWTSSPAGFTSSVQNPADVVATASTTYSVTVTNAFGCSSSATTSVTANPLPVVTLGNDTAVCATGLPVTLDAGNAGAAFLWNDMSTAQTLSASAAGSYDVSVTDANGCVGKDTIAVAINPDPVVALGTDTIRCGGSVTLDAGNTGSAYLWSDASANQTLTVSATGNYDVTVTDANGCKGYDTVVVTINTIPTVDLGNDTLVCGTGLTLDAGNAGNSFLWNTTDMTQTINVTITGDYFVDVTTPQSCTARDTVHVTIAAPITVNIGNDSLVCSITSVILDAENPGSDYLWSDGTNSSTLIVTTPGTYSVVVTSADGCTAQDTVVFTDNSPLVDLTLPFSITCVTSSVNTLSGGSPVGGSFSGTAVTGTNFDATAAGVGTYLITYTYTDGTTGCFATDTQSVVVDPCVGIKELSTVASIVVAPNPTTGYFSISMPSREIVLKAEMYTIEGQLISSETYKGREVYEVNITELANAVYYLRLTVDGETNVVKVVKQQ